MGSIPLKKSLPTDKIKDLRNTGSSDDEIVKSLRSGYSNEEVDDAMNKENLRQDNILNSLDEFEPIQKEQPEDKGVEEGEEELLEEAPAPEETEESEARLIKGYDYEPRPSAEASSEKIQEIVETIVEEKWEDLLAKVGDLNLWKESVNNDLEAIKQELLRTQERFNNLQAALVGKVTDYSRNISDMNAEMKALEQVLKNILEPLTTNVKELSRITSQFKKKKK